MADEILTTASTVTCPHGFAITFTSAATLTVAGTAVVRKADVAGAVLMCTAQQKCTAIKTFKAATTLLDGDSPVVLASGLETNTGPCQVSAGHDLLHPE